MESFDCLIIGGGPAGLTGAVYLARYRRRIILFDGGDSRASLILKSHNYPGFPEGVSGPGLLQALRKQAWFCSSAQAKRTCVRRRGDPPGQSFMRSSFSFLISPILVAFSQGIGMKSIGRAHRTETDVATSTLPRIAFE